MGVVKQPGTEGSVGREKRKKYIKKRSGKGHCWFTKILKRFTLRGGVLSGE